MKRSESQQPVGNWKKMEVTKKRAGTARRLNRHTKHLPVVGLDTIQAVIAEMPVDKEKVFRDVAIGNPTLYWIYLQYVSVG